MDPMNRALLSIPAGLVAAALIVATPPAVGGCAAFSHVETTVPPLVGCILQAAAGDFVEAIVDPASLVPAILGQCAQYGEVTAAAIIAAIESWFASTPDAGSDAGSIQASRLRRVHDLLVGLSAAKKL